MKKVLFLFTMSLFFMFACNTEDFEQTELNTDAKPQVDLKIPISIYNFDKDGNPVEIKKITLEEFSHMTAMKGPNSQSINGHFTNQTGAVTTVSAMQNPGGVHGNTIIKGSFGSLKLEALCVWNEENVGMAGGIILDAGFNVVDGFPYGPGDQLYFVYKDNGEGNNADLDQYVQAFFFLTLEAWGGETPFGICEFLPPPSFWDTFFSTPELCGCPEPVGYKDVAKKSDQIQIN